MGKLFLLIRTLKYLKIQQILYRILYFLRRKYRNAIGFNYKFSLYRKGKPLNLVQSIGNADSFENNQFTFLNQTVHFSEKIDWDYSKNGKLWTYNLNYFDFLEQKSISKEVGLVLIYNYIDQLKDLKNGIEPYPISLRGVNWIKFISKFHIEKKSIDLYLYSQYRILLDNVEYHILGNHLLENGVSLLFSGYYFKGLELYKKGKEIISSELNEQILQDGAHFELSPMYHKILLNRILDCLNLVTNNEVYSDEKFNELIKVSAIKMLGWLDTITFQDGTTPRVNDSTENIAPDSIELFDYAARLGLSWKPVKLSESGYRNYLIDDAELFIDVGNIGPDYIPGHAHSDTLSFIFNFNRQPIIVDRGISTYDANKQRQVERSTSSHNTVVVNNTEQSEVWSSFRVGRRAKAKIIKESKNHISAIHDGYKRIGLDHKRTFNVNQDSIIIIDELITNSNRENQGVSYLHFHPGLVLNVDGNTVNVNNISITFIGAKDICVEDYDYALGYNHCVSALRVKVPFIKELKFIIKWS